jgi:ribonucleoside-diphosphate reductase alpha chain
VIKDAGPVEEDIKDWGYARGIKGKTADQCSVDDHLEVLRVASYWSDSAVSKTVNVGDVVTWAEFKDVYVRAWKLGCKGCTTFRPSGKRFGVLNKTEETEGAACHYDPETGKKTCE